MGTTGCHNCNVDLSKYKDAAWEDIPCSQCSLSKEYVHTFSTGLFDVSKNDEVEDRHDYTSKFPEEHEFVWEGTYPLKAEELNTLETIKNAIEHQVCLSLSGVILRLISMAITKPKTFEVWVKKMQYPYMSYSDIGDTMSPKCSKQNVLYHLKEAVNVFPELSSVIQTDTRYKSGNYALQPLAEKRRREEAEQRVRKRIYGEDADSMLLSIDEINKILQSPLLLRNEVMEFNPYIEQDRKFLDDLVKNQKADE